MPPVALNPFEYATPAIAPDRVVVVTLNVGGGCEDAVTVTVAAPDLVKSATLVAVTVAVILEDTVGAVYKPETETVPEEAVQVTATFEVLLTRAVNCCTAPEDKVAAAGVTATATLPLVETVTWNGWLAECVLESVAATVKLYDPVLLGIPEIVPVAAPKASPAGSCPVATVNWYGAIPPVTVNGALYFTPLTAAGNAPEMAMLCEEDELLLVPLAPIEHAARKEIEDTKVITAMYRTTFFRLI